MAVTISVIILIALVSLYDYFTAKNWQQVTSVTRNDIVFEDRNKAYGAYMIRKNYDKRILFIMLGLCILIGGSFGVYKYIKSIPEPKIEEAPVDMTQFDLPPPPPEEEVPPPPVEPPPPNEKMIAFIPPIVVDAPTEDKLPTEDELKNQNVGDQDVKGNDNFNPDPDPITYAPPPPPPPDDPVEVDEPAMFPGGKKAFIAFLQDNLNYPQTAQEEGIQGTTWIGFVVDREGNMSEVAVLKKLPGCPECDAEALRVVKKVPKWIPGKNNGKPAKSRFQVPITYQLE